MTDNHAADIPAMGPMTEASFQMTLSVFSQLLSRSVLHRHWTLTAVAGCCAISCPTWRCGHGSGLLLTVWFVLS